MNKVYSLVWNRSRMQVEVASELAHSRAGGTSGKGCGAGAPLMLKLLAAAIVLSGSLGWATQAFAAQTACTFDNVANGTMFCGFGANATGNGAVAIGDTAVATGDGTSAFGEGATASNTSASAFGENTLAAGVGSSAFGNGAKSYGNQSTAIGGGSQAGVSGGLTNQSIALGANSGATGDQSTALGNNAMAQGNSSIAIGGDDVDKVAQATYTATINGTSETKTGAQLFTDLTGSTAIASG